MRNTLKTIGLGIVGLVVILISAAALLFICFKIGSILEKDSVLFATSFGVLAVILFILVGWAIWIVGAFIRDLLPAAGE
ncbi:hypothetical protein AD951_02695 [Acetobacter malorum]|uniref:Uncharacterized protein n=1 Tax=Acetobacter malorum TaxID=178901 RepID=A0A149URR0_9PROT|nr:hypothetical protein [Acetobacter malorum]KXV70534.1 hypothetical protein AD951_02695 [Acetobacter malorum]